MLALGLMMAVVATGGVARAEGGVSWAVMDARSGQVIAEDGGRTLHPPASLAKMMTLYLTFEALRAGRLHWDDRITMSANAESKVRMKLNVKAGSTISVREAVNGMIIISANDAATAMAEHLAGSEEAFGRQMTDKARRLGMESTVFVTPSGLTAKARQVTTPLDMARLGLALKRDFPAQYPLFAQRQFSFRGRVLHGHNNLMYRYDGVDGIKTGYTDASGYNLVSSLNRPGHQLIGVVLGGRSARSRDDKMAALLTEYSKGGVALAARDRKEAPKDREASGNRAKPDIEPMAASSLPKPLDRPTKMAGKGKRGDEMVLEQGDGGTPVAADDGTAWKIQIGTSKTKDGANVLREKAEGVLTPAMTSAAAGEVVRAGKGKQVLYKARIAGFPSNASANKACSLLKKHGMQCFAFTSGS